MAVTAQSPWRNAIVRYGEEPPEQLLAHPRNPKVHPRAQQLALEGAISELGWLAPVTVNERTQHVLDGHARISLAISRREASVPVAYVDLPEELEALALATFDPIGNLAGTDKDALDSLLQEISTGDAALQEFLGGLAQENGLTFGDGGLPVAEAPEPEIDRAEELREKWQTAAGQLWAIGRHRLLCGDSTKGGGVARLLNGDRPRLMVTDPPYGVGYDAGWRDDAAAKGLIAHAASRVGTFAHDDRDDWREAWSLFPGDVVYAWHADLRATAHSASLEATGFELRAQIIWAKPRFVISQGHYHFQHEPCWYAVRKGATAQWCGDRSQTTLWEIPLNPNVDGGHSTQKPLECMARPIRNHEGDVYDPFLGSGTTMAAAEQLGRTCYGVEIEPKYVAVILERLSQMGLSPRLESGG